MSISSYTMVTMLDSRPSPITIAMPRTTDIPNRVITFKDIYGAALYSTVTLVTQGGDVFENSSFSTILSNAYDTVTFHAGLTNRWHRTAGTNVVGSVTNASTFTNSISTNALTAGYISTSAIYGKFYGDGSQITNLSITFSGTTQFNNITVSNNISNGGTVSTNILTAGTISNYGNISNSGNISTNTLFAATGSFTGTSNTGNLGVAGTTTLAITSNTGTFGVLGVTTLGVTNTGSISNTGNISTNTLFAATGSFTSSSNTGSLGVAGTTTLAITSNTGTFGVLGVTTLGVTNTGSISNSGVISTLGLNVGALSSINISTVNFAAGSVSTLNLDAKAANVSSLSFYDIVTSSTGTFRYSTLTASGLTALPPVSLLYFNNFVVAGAYVWPGQTIQGLNWTASYNGLIQYTVTTGKTFQFAAADFPNCNLASNITGGTPPYTFVDVSAPSLASFGLSTNIYAPGGKVGLLTGTVNGITSNNFTVNLIDNSPIKMVRPISFTLTTANAPV